jgi:capsular polysaccharide biosynthesis protein
MELKRYWSIVYRRWWLIAGLVLVVGVVSLATYDWRPDPMHAATFRFNVGLDPVPPPDTAYEYNPLDVWMSSEYFVDDLASAVRGATFARRVARRLEGEGVNPVGAFGAATEHRVLTVSIRWGDAAQLARIANAAVAVLEEEAADLVGPLGRARPVMQLIDPPSVVPVGRSLQGKLDIPIRLGLAVLAGVASAFLLDYLDASIRDRREVEAMGVRVLGQIPRQK